MAQRSVEQQLADVEQRLKKVESYMLWTTILGAARFIIIAVPIILALIFVPPLVKKYLPFADSIISASDQLIKHFPSNQ